MIEQLKHKCTKEALLLWIIGILLIAGAIIIFFPRVDAIYQVEYQGDIVYLGEYCDVTKVLGWEMQFAWWAGDEIDSTPDKIVDASSFSKNHYIDPAKYCEGEWFKWDGEAERRGNNLAFIVKKGTRNTTQTVVTGKATPVPTPTPVPPAKNIPKDTHVLIARGDDGTIRYALGYNQSTGKEQIGSLWLFGSADSKTKILGEPLTYSKNDSVYSYFFNHTMTEGLTEGWYTGYFQFAGDNGFLDVFYDAKNNNLDTPYDDTIIPDKNLDPYIPVRIKQEFELLEKPSKYCDDILVPITMELKTPQINFREYYESGDNITIEGDTTMNQGTMIVFMIDPDRWALSFDKMAHTWSTQATGLQKERRTFKIDMPINWKEMAVGANHTVRATIEKYKIKVMQFKDFKVTDVYIMPTPTPEKIRILSDEYGWHNLITPEPTPAPTATPTSIKTPNITTNTSAAQSTATTSIPAPTAVPTPNPTPTISVPVETATILIAVGLGLWRMKR